MSKKVLNIITLVLLACSVIVAFFTFSKTTAIKDNAGLLDPIFIWVLLLFLAALALLIILPIPALIQKPKALMRTLFLLVGIVVFIVIVYLLSSGKPDGDAILINMQPLQADEYKAKSLAANMNINGVTIALMLAIVALVGAGLKKFVEKNFVKK